MKYRIRGYSSQVIGAKGQTRCEAGAQSYGSANDTVADRQTAECDHTGGFYIAMQEYLSLYEGGWYRLRNRYSFQFYSSDPIRKVRSFVKRKAISIVTALMAAILITTTVFAGAIRLSGTARLGSIEFFGTAYGLGRTDWILDMSATGHADVICTNNGSNDVRGQSSPKVTGKATETLPADSQLRKNGKSTFTITAKPEEEVNPIIPWDLGGCPNPNWTAKIFFVYWDSLTILVKDPDTGLVVEEFNYTCNTTYIPQNDGYTFDDGTITCEEIN